ncbi:MAG: NHL repeat-containing protein [Elusimicrobia bacterium]|nr:NHL repeat-containing protein [Elusimicrobiota bacterium]
MKKFFFLYYLAWQAAGAMPAWAYVSNQSADVVIGHEKFSQVGYNATDPAPYTLNNPYQVFFDGTKLYVVESANSRVLIYNAIPTSNNASADVVVGQPDLYSNKPNQGMSKPAANTLNVPQGVYSNGSKLFIADFSNNRVLVYNSIPTSNNANADVVIGQPDMVSNAMATTQTGIRGPRSVYAGGKLFIPEYYNNRVLVYDSVPTINGASATYVLGHNDFTTATANDGGLSAGSLYAPFGVFADGEKLYVADSGNNRVLIFNSLPSSNKPNADVVIGQSGFTANSANPGGIKAWTLSFPVGVFKSAEKLFIADAGNHRIFISSWVPTVNGSSATWIVGQPGVSSGTANQTGAGSLPTANTLYNPYGVQLEGTKLLVSDTSNNRVLVYNTLPSTHNHTADVVIGQNSMTDKNSNQGVVARANTFYQPFHAITDGTKLFASDTYNNRVLIFNSLPSSNKASADVVIGQVDLSTGNANQGFSGPDANRLYYPKGLYLKNNKLFVADSSNNRVLIFNSVPTSNNAGANIVIGQSSMTAKIVNSDGLGGTSRSLSSLYQPSGVCYDGTKLFIADQYNHRVLVFNSLPTTHHETASIVLGQVDVTSGTANRGGSVAANTMNYPESVDCDGTKLYVADYGNHRVLIFNYSSLTHGATADVVIGQADFNQNSVNQGNATPDANTLYSPRGVHVSGGKLFISDFYNNRVLIYNTVPSTHNARADYVIGQPTVGDKNANQAANPSASSLYYPTGVFAYSGKLYAADYVNNRVLIYNDQSSAPSSQPANAKGTALGISSITWSWDMVSGASYRILTSTSGTVAVSLGTNTYTETNLSTNTAYTRLITAYNDLGASSATITAYTLSTAPVNLAVSTGSVTHNSLTLAWDTNTNPAGTYYSIQKSSAAEFIAFSTAVPVSDSLILTTKTLTGLLPETTYFFRILSYNGDRVASKFYSTAVSTLTAPASQAYLGSISTAAATVNITSAAIFAARDALTQVQIPAGVTFPGNATTGIIVISTSPLTVPIAANTAAISEANAKIDTSRNFFTNTIREFAFYDLTGGVNTGNFSGGNVTITIPYTDANQDGWVDGSNPPLQVSRLAVFTLNETTKIWESLGKGTVNSANKTVSIGVSHFSVYALGGEPAASDFGSLKVFPVPWRIGSQTKFDADNLMFDNVTTQATLRIYTVLGELVDEKTSDNTGGRLYWNGKNMAGEPVGSGVYIWRITNPAGEGKQGRIVIER